MLFRKFEAVETAEGTRYLLDGEEIRHVVGCALELLSAEAVFGCGRAAHRAGAAAGGWAGPGAEGKRHAGNAASCRYAHRQRR